MTDVATLLRQARLVAVLTIERAEDALPLAHALIAGGVRTLEITLRTPAAADACARIRHHVPKAQVGLGTVTTPAHLHLAKDLDLPFAFSPGTTPELLDEATRLGVPFIPGVATPSDIVAALARGFTTLKLFPAEQLGGPALLRSLAGPFPDFGFNPTGGITLTNMPAYLALSNVLAVGGSWLAPAADVRAGRWTEITERARTAMALLDASPA